MRIDFYKHLWRQLLPSLTVGVWVCVSVCLFACNSKPKEVPATFTEVADMAQMYPDYRDVTIPPNIAPLNFMVKDKAADAFVADLGGLVCGAGKDGKMDIDTTAWRSLLAEHRGKDVEVRVYAHREQGWVRHPAFLLHVAEEDIDGYLSYSCSSSLNKQTKPFFS